jgi:hypothetical protein
VNAYTDSLKLKEDPTVRKKLESVKKALEKQVPPDKTAQES